MKEEGGKEERETFKPRYSPKLRLPLSLSLSLLYLLCSALPALTSAHASTSTCSSTNSERREVSSQPPQLPGPEEREGGKRERERENKRSLFSSFPSTVESGRQVNLPLEANLFGKNLNRRRRKEEEEEEEEACALKCLPSFPTKFPYRVSFSHQDRREGETDRLRLLLLLPPPPPSSRRQPRQPRSHDGRWK